MIISLLGLNNQDYRNERENLKWDISGMWRGRHSPDSECDVRRNYEWGRRVDAMVRRIPADIRHWCRQASHEQ